MRKTGYIISLIAGICLGFCAKNSHAYMLPTIDVGAIAEGIKSNIELVKQSSIVVQATQFTGKISATLGDVKSSLTELAQSEAARMAELAKKQAENLQKAKEEYEKYKKRIEEEKAELEEGLAILNAAKGGTDQYASGTPARKQQTNLRPCGREKRVSLLGSKPYR